MIDFNKIIRLGEGQIKTAGEVLARAFFDYPQFDHLLPDLDERTKKIKSIFEFIVRYGIMFGEVYSTSPNLEAVAIWLPYWKSVMTPMKMLNLHENLSGDVADYFLNYSHETVFNSYKNYLRKYYKMNNFGKIPSDRKLEMHLRFLEGFTVD